MATPYSTVTECRTMVSKAATIAMISDANILAVIVLADKKVKEDLSNIYDMTAVDAAVTTPDPVNELSRFKTNEWVLVKLFGAKRSIEEVSDIQYWQREYNDKLAAIVAGSVALGPLALTTQAFSNVCKKDVLPALGHGKYGGFIDEDSLEGIRTEDTDE